MVVGGLEMQNSQPAGMYTPKNSRIRPLKKDWF